MISALKKALRSYALYIGLSALVVIAAIWGFTMERLDFVRNNATADTVRKNDGLALAFEEHTIRTMILLESTLYHLRRAYLREGSKLDVRALFESEAIDRTLVLNAAVVGEAGDILISAAPIRAGINAAEREYFVFHRQHADSGMMIGKPLVGLVTGESSLHMTRRIDRPDGSFGGVAVLPINPEYFIRFYDQLNLGSNGQLMLLGLDGIVRARRTGTAISVGADFRGRTLFNRLSANPAGQFVSRGELDGVRRHLSYRTVRGFPLVVVVGTAEADLALEDRVRSRYYMSMAAALSVAVLLLSAAIGMAIRRRQIAFDEAVKSGARYGAAFDQAVLGMAHFSADGRYLKANAQLCSMLGYTETELRLLAFRDTLHQEEAASEDMPVNAFDRTLSEQHVQFECRQRCKNRTVLWTSVSLTAVRGVKEELQYVLGIVQDITERKHAEEGRIATLRRVRAQQEAAGAVASSGSLMAGEVEPLAREITELIAKTAGVERANVWLFNDDETELYCIDCYEATPARHTAGAVLAEKQFASEFAALKRANYVDADDALTDPRTAGYVEGYVKPLGITSMLDAVIQISGRHLGVVCLEHVGKPHLWERDEVAFACHLADKLALALVNRTRRKAEEASQENQRRLSDLMSNLPGMAYRCADDPYWTMEFVSNGCLALTGYAAADLIGNARVAYGDLIVHDDADMVWNGVQHALVAREPYVLTYRIRDRAGQTRWVWEQGAGVFAPDGGLLALEGFITDITEGKQATLALQRSERHFRKLIQGSSDGFFVIDASGTQIFCSDSAERLLGHPSSELMGTSFMHYLDPESLPRARSAFAQVLERPDEPVQAELRVVRSDGGMTDLEGVAVNRLHDPDVGGIVVTVRDVTERKRATLALEQSERRFRKLIQGSTDAFILVDANGNELFRSDSAEKITGYSAAEMLGKPATSYIHPDSLPAARIALAEALANPGNAAMLEARFIRRDGVVVDLEAAGRNLLDDPDVGGIVMTVRDVSERKRTEEALRQGESRLSGVLQQTVQAMALTIEQRAPYMAGHHRRASALARALAAEMELTHEQSQGLAFASSIYDIGMIAIPAEVLNRPSELRKHERELLKTHVQAGYEIVRNIEFPWRVAEIMLQHHERLDGSGYPRGLKAEAILPEASVLGVADTVEAMTSHRPYRSSLGIDLALDELVKHRGIRYDAAVVDACVKLFREQGFAFPS